MGGESQIGDAIQFDFFKPCVQFLFRETVNVDDE
jgi:hypothetical protein